MSILTGCLGSVSTTPKCRSTSATISSISLLPSTARKGRSSAFARRSTYRAIRMSRSIRLFSARSGSLVSRKLAESRRNRTSRRNSGVGISQIACRGLLNTGRIQSGKSPAPSATIILSAGSASRSSTTSRKRSVHISMTFRAISSGERCTHRSSMLIAMNDTRDANCSGSRSRRAQ